jgi:hypothetical protein
MRKPIQVKISPMWKLRDAVLLRASSTPRKPQSEMKLGKHKPKGDASASPKKLGPREPQSTHRSRPQSDGT